MSVCLAQAFHMPMSFFLNNLLFCTTFLSIIYYALGAVACHFNHSHAHTLHRVESRLRHRSVSSSNLSALKTMLYLASQPCMSIMRARSTTARVCNVSASYTTKPLCTAWSRACGVYKGVHVGVHVDAMNQLPSPSPYTTSKTTDAHRPRGLTPCRAAQDPLDTSSCPVPEDQQPVREYQLLQDQSLFNWATMSVPGFVLRLCTSVWIAWCTQPSGVLICIPISVDIPIISGCMCITTLM